MDAGASLTLSEREACGYLTLVHNTVLKYDLSGPQIEKAERGIRWDDPHFGIDWGGAPAVINERDKNWPDFVPQGKT